MERRRREHQPAASVVSAFVNDSIDENGWVAFRVRPAGPPSSVVAVESLYYDAGYAEGSMMSTRIWQHFTNVVQPSPDMHLHPKTKAWLRTHIAFLEAGAASWGNTTVYWSTVARLLLQLHGITDGFNAASSSTAAGSQHRREMTFFDIFVLNFNFELGDVNYAVGVSTSPLAKSGKMITGIRGGCTAIVRPATDDLFMAHTTWTEYSAMLRVYHDIELDAGLRIAFSGYPGMIASGDDFYLLSNGLAVQETTNVIDNGWALADAVIPQSVSEFLRVIVAHRVAGADGNEWTNTFCRHNSGTYNNQYMVVNFNRYTPGVQGAQLPDGLLWVVEQMPGMCPMSDATDVLRTQGYWASYNRPYFPSVNVLSGNANLSRTVGSLFSYSDYARPRIIQRAMDSSSGVQTLADVQALFRFNEWKTDPLSRCPECEHPSSSPVLTIAARGDLIPAGGSWGPWGPYITGAVWNYLGAIDGKVVSWRSVMHGDFSASIVSGPTHTGQPAFQWSTWARAGNISHVGQADLQAFDWVNTSSLFPRLN